MSIDGNNQNLTVEDTKEQLEQRQPVYKDLRATSLPDTQP